MDKKNVSRRSFLQLSSTGAILFTANHFAPSIFADNSPENGIYRIECVLGGRTLDRDSSDTSCFLGKNATITYDEKGFAKGVQVTGCRGDQPPQSGQKVQLWGPQQPNPNTKVNHLWRLTKLNDGLYDIATAENSDFRLDAHQPDVAKDGCKIQVWSFPKGGTVGMNARWRFVRSGDAYYIKNGERDERYLNAHKNDTSKDGCRVQLWGHTGADNERWRLIKIA